MTQNSLKPLWRTLRQLDAYYPIILIYSVCVSILTLATPISVQSLVSTFSFGPVFQPIFVLSMILLGLLTLLGLMKSLQYLVVEYLQQKLYAKTTAIMSHAYYNKDVQSEVSINNKANRYFDIILVHKNLAFLVTDGITIALQTVLGLLLISIYHPFFIIFGLLIFLAIVIPVSIFGKSAMHSAVEESTAKYEVADYITNLALDQNEKAEESTFFAKTSDEIDWFLQKRRRHFRTMFTQNILYMALYAGLNSLLLALGGYLVIKNQLSVGQLVAAEIVVNAILSHFLYAKKYLESFYDMYAATVKIYPFYDHLDKVAKQLAKEDKKRIPKERHLFKSIKSIGKIYSPESYKRIFKIFTISVVSIVFVFCLVPWQQFSRAYGKVMAFDPNDREQTITAPLEGIVQEWLVQDGQFVKKGEPIVRVVDNDPQYLTRLESARDAAVAKFEAAKEASDTSRLNFHRQEKLVAEGLSSQKEFEQAKIKYKKLQAEEAAAVAGLAKTEVDLSRQQQQTVVAPRDGQIRRILLGSGTTNVKEGQALAEFVPTSSEIVVTLFVDGNDLPLVYPGRKVRLQFEGWPAIQLTGWPSVAVGSFGGIVDTVDPSVAEDGTFRVLVKPDPDDGVNWPNQAILRQGSRAMGIINLDQVTIGYELWRQVNGFPKSMKSAPDALDIGKRKKKKK